MIQLLLTFDLYMICLFSGCISTHDSSFLQVICFQVSFLHVIHLFSNIILHMIQLFQKRHSCTWFVCFPMSFLYVIRLFSTNRPTDDCFFKRHSRTWFVFKHNSCTWFNFEASFLHVIPFQASFLHVIRLFSNTYLTHDSLDSFLFRCHSHT